MMFRSSVGTKDTFEARPDTGADVLINGAADFLVDVNYVREVTYSGSAVALWANGAVSLAATAAATATTTMTRVNVGAWGALNNSSYQGLIGRITTCNRVLGATERSYVRVGLGDQFAITVAP
jgi:hypothetical protein